MSVLQHRLEAGQVLRFRIDQAFDAAPEQACLLREEALVEQDPQIPLVRAQLRAEEIDAGQVLARG